MNLNAFFNAELDEHKSALAATREVLGEPFQRLVGACAEAVRGGGRIVFFGNGGSAADAQHLAAELSVRYQRDRVPIAGFALTTNTSALTAIGNDFGFEDLFARQIQALCKPDDVVIGISTSGNSANIIKALREAKKLGAVAAGFGGGDGGQMLGLADPFLLVPNNNVARVQEMHITLGHMLCGALEQELRLL
ncbi:MAG TPA: SIS domain-containing protein [Rhodospirillales bacterium]|jgi:D-sedoheptulose 7-phosphate isomerase|nr:SIS domain-containing protein [Rhodospirillales bacterium]